MDRLVSLGETYIDAWTQKTVLNKLAIERTKTENSEHLKLTKDSRKMEAKAVERIHSVYIPVFLWKRTECRLHANEVPTGILSKPRKIQSNSAKIVNPNCNQQRTMKTPYVTWRPVDFKFSRSMEIPSVNTTSTLFI